MKSNPSLFLTTENHSSKLQECSKNNNQTMNDNEKKIENTFRLQLLALLKTGPSIARLQ
jgi:hypothetical protein